MASNRTHDSEFSLRAALWDLRTSFTDVSLVCRRGPGGRNNVLRCHKVILAASSSYFMKTFSLRNRDEVHLPKVDFNVMLNLAEFIYTGQAPEAEHDFPEFVRLGRKLSVKGLPAWKPMSGIQIQQDVPTVLPGTATPGRKRRQEEDDAEQLETGQTGFPVAPAKRRRLEDVSAKPRLVEVAKPRKQLRLTDLPDEVLLRILSHVSTSDLLLNVSVVSKQFSTLVRDPDAHISVTFNNAGNTAKVAKFFRNKTKIREIYLTAGSQGRTTIEPVTWASVVSRLKKLKVLNASSPGLISSRMIDLLGQDAERAWNLTKIVASPLTDDMGYCWIHPTSIRHLELNGAITSSYLVKIAQTTNTLETLRSKVKLQNEERMRYVLNANRSSLKEVDLQHYEACVCDVREISSCAKLEVLSLDCSDIAPPVLNILSGLQNLRVLRLELYRQLIDTRGIAQFVVNQNEVLETLSLTYDGNLDDSVMKSVAKLTQLRSLTLSCKLGPSAVTSRGFCEVFTGCVNLTSLFFRMQITASHQQEQPQQRINSLSNLSHPNLKYIRPGNGGFLTSQEIGRMLKRSPAMRACHQGEVIFVKSDTTCKDIFDGFEEDDLREILIKNVDVV